MEARAYVQRAALVITICAVVAGIFLPSYAMAGDQPPGVLPPNANPHGASYGEWGGRWWTWAWTQPPAVNPVLDTTGEFCAQGQSGAVWFLAGTFVMPSLVTRTCTIPVGKALFFPVYNISWFTGTADVVYCEANYSSLEECALDLMKQGVDPALQGFAAAGGMQVIVDGKPVDLAVTDAVNSPFRVVSPEFSMLLPFDNVLSYLGYINESSCPMVDNGYDCNPYYADGVYVMLAPLSAGSHTLRIVAPGAMDVTYNLTIQPKNGGKGQGTSGAASVENPQNQLFVPFVRTEP